MTSERGFRLHVSGQNTLSVDQFSREMEKLIVSVKGLSVTEKKNRKKNPTAIPNRNPPRPGHLPHPVLPKRAALALGFIHGFSE